MRTIHNKIKLAAGVLAVAALMVSCLPKTQTMGDAGQTLIKLYPEGFTLVALDAVATPQQAVLFEVRRDVHSEAALNSATTVVLKYDESIIDAYNEENETEFIPLPTSLGTTEPAPSADGTITLVFGNGEFAKGPIIKIPDATQFDFAQPYALAYKIVSVSGTGKLSEAVGTEVMVQVLVKNKYDGVYQVTEVTPMLDVVNASLTGYYPFTYKLETSGAHSCLCFDSEIWGDYMHPIMSGTNISGYDSFGIEVFFDPSGDGTIIDLKNPWGNPPANTRMPVLDPSGVNKWDPATHNIQIKYWMIQPSVVTTPPHIRTYFDELWIYKGPR